MAEDSFARLERSQMLPTVLTVLRLSRVLRVSTDYLFGLTPLDGEDGGAPAGKPGQGGGEAGGVENTDP